MKRESGPTSDMNNFKPDGFQKLPYQLGFYSYNETVQKLLGQAILLLCPVFQFNAHALHYLSMALFSHMIGETWELPYKWALKNKNDVPSHDS